MKKLVSVKKILKGGLLQAGQHATEISEVSLVESEPSTQWADRTAQLKVAFKNAAGSITRWYNTIGYKSISDFPTGIAPKGFEFRSSESGNENYLVNIKTGLRVENDEKSETCATMLGELLEDAGIPAGTDFSDEATGEVDFEAVAKALYAKPIGLMVKEDNGKVNVAYTMHVEKVKTAIIAED